MSEPKELHIARPTAIHTWLQRADDELLYDTETFAPQEAALAVDDAARLAMAQARMLQAVVAAVRKQATG